MSSNSLRNSLHRRNHKERGQLAHRSRLGLLEKHKDYALRARDYHSKQDRLRRLKQKAADRNQDEFYFGMVNQRTKDGVHVHERGNVGMPVDVVKLLKTQDGNYIRTVRAAGAKKIDALKNELGAVADLAGGDWQDEELAPEEKRALQDAGLLPPTPSSSKKRKRAAAPKHLVFVDNQEQARSMATWKSSEPAEPEAEDAEDEDLGWITETNTKQRKRSAPQPEPQVPDAASADEDEDEDGDTKPKRHRSRLIKELAARLVRDRSLKYAERELEMQRLLMGKGQAKKLSGAEKVGADDDDDDDDFDVPKKGRSKKPVKMTPEQEAAWKPRVYKWKFDRRR